MGLGESKPCSLSGPKDVNKSDGSEGGRTGKCTQLVAVPCRLPCEVKEREKEGEREGVENAKQRNEESEKK